MYKTLPQFYNSDEWRKFRAGLIDARTDKDTGILLDEFSGDALIKSYDIVLHHKVPLTMQNVNDFSISLNPENIMIVSQRSHNELHARFGYCTQRKVYYVYGAPCSGKTSFVLANKGNSDIIVDMDSIWQCITGEDRYVKPDALKANAFAVRDCLLDMIRTRAGKWERAFIISGGAVKGIREREIQLYGAEPIFIQETQKTCLERLASDLNRTPAQRSEWEKYIFKWFADYKE